MPKRKRPSQASGQAPRPSKRQVEGAKKKKPWDAAAKAAEKASSWLNPFD